MTQGDESDIVATIRRVAVNAGADMETPAGRELDRLLTAAKLKASHPVVIEVGGGDPKTWRYEADDVYLFAERWLTGEVRLEVGFTGISEEPAHSIKMPDEVASAFMAWLTPFRRGS